MIKVTEAGNGYILEVSFPHATPIQTLVFVSFESMINHIAFVLNERSIGETFKLVLEKESNV